MKDLMKQTFKYLITALSALIVLLACEKPEDSQTQDPPQQEQQEEQKIGTYKYDGKEYPVYSMSVSADESQIFVRISPFKEGEKQTTYAVLGVNTSLQGTVIDVENAWHNDDYYFVYEDPVVYYSQYRQLQSGTMMIRKVGESVEVKADLILPDGKKFAFEYIE
jgi:hypothetical protein